MHENWVIYSYPFIHTELAKNSKEIELKFKKLLCLVKQSMSNKKGREYVLKNYEKTKVVHNLVSMLNKY